MYKRNKERISISIDKEFILLKRMYKKNVINFNKSIDSYQIKRVKILSHNRINIQLKHFHRRNQELSPDYNKHGMQSVMKVISNHRIQLQAVILMTGNHRLHNWWQWTNLKMNPTLKMRIKRNFRDKLNLHLNLYIEMVSKCHNKIYWRINLDSMCKILKKEALPYNQTKIIDQKHNWEPSMS